MSWVAGFKHVTTLLAIQHKLGCCFSFAGGFSFWHSHLEFLLVCSDAFISPDGFSLLGFFTRSGFGNSFEFLLFAWI
jgi:hypothetical protein